MIKLRQGIHVWYELSCGCIARYLGNRVGNTAHCPHCGEYAKVFILSTHYEKLEDD